MQRLCFADAVLLVTVSVTSESPVILGAIYITRHQLCQILDALIPGGDEAIMLSTTVSNKARQSCDQVKKTAGYAQLSSNDSPFCSYITRQAF